MARAPKVDPKTPSRRSSRPRLETRSERRDDRTRRALSSAFERVTRFSIDRTWIERIRGLFALSFYVGDARARARVGRGRKLERGLASLSPLTAVVLIELVQRLEPGDRRLVYRKLPRDVLARLPRGLLPGTAARSLLARAPALLPALRPTLLPRDRFRRVAAAMDRRVPARVPATWTLPAARCPPIGRQRDHAAPGILALRLRSLVERAVPVARDALSARNSDVFRFEIRRMAAERGILSRV